MSDSTMLKKLLEAESASRGLVREAEETADRRVREALASFQDELRKAREERFGKIAAEEKAFTRELAAAGDARLSTFEESLRGAKISHEDAEREIKAILLP